MVKLRGERLQGNHIIAVLQPDRWMTRKDIATALVLNVHPAFINMLEGLVTEGIIERFEEVTNRGLPRLWYSTTPATVLQAQEALIAEREG